MQQTKYESRPTIVLDVFRHVIVDNVLNVGKVETFRSDVGRNQNVLLSVHELLHRNHSLLLV